MAVTLTAVVPTLGTSPLLVPALEALRADGGGEVAIVVVHQGGGEGPRLPPGLADEVLTPPRNLGFAAGTNLGLARAVSPWVAAVNDDLLVEPGWYRALVEALETRPGAAAAQGVNLRLDAPERVDGLGIGWNGAWQAVQVGRGGPAPGLGDPVREVFGASATAAVFRAEALGRVALAGGAVFDPRLGSYYEDVELACRLRGAGYTAWCVPRARARHAGSLTGGRHRVRRLTRIYGNRHLVLARLLGSAFPRALPAALLRDLRDLARALLRLDAAAAAGIAGGWARAVHRLPRFAHRGDPAVPAAELERFRVAA